MLTDSKVQVTLSVIFKAKAGKEHELKTELLALLTPTRKENGCLNYDLHEDPNDNGRFLFYENWESQGDLDKHINSAHVQNFFKHAPSLIEDEVELVHWKLIN
jgi:quinol monooxygenase YgiN